MTLEGHLLVPFMKLTGELEPHDDEIERYIANQAPPPAESEALRQWLDEAQTGTAEVEVCTNCWAIEVLDPDDPDSAQLHFNACERCQRSICNFCHQHPAADRRNRCLCGDCGTETGKTKLRPA